MRVKMRGDQVKALILEGVFLESKMIPPSIRPRFYRKVGGMRTVWEVRMSDGCDVICNNPEEAMIILKEEVNKFHNTYEGVVEP